MADPAKLMRFVLLLLALIAAERFPAAHAQAVLKGDFWKQQALTDIIPAWEQHVFNEETGGFHAYLKRDWTPYQHNRQYPGMLSRQLFSFSAAYLLSGDQHYLALADSTFRYMVRHGWDTTYGGWYAEIGPHGRVTKAGKDLFMQTYAITGLTLYYATTRNPEAKAYLDTTYQRLRTQAWDQQNQGYYNSLTQDWQVADPQKDFSPQLAPASGFLTYLYPITRKAAYRDHFQTLLTMAWEKMRHPRQPWIMESFTRDWQLIKGQNTHMNVGHNAEVVWLMLRLYHLTGDPVYRKHARTLHQPLVQQAYDTASGAWYHQIPVDKAQPRTATASWWVQAYGNMTQLYLYRVTQDQQYLERFQAGCRFWNKAFLDEQYGGTVLKADLAGNPEKGAKAVRTKTAYHAMEHALLNYCYLKLWVQDQPARLHYRLTNTTKGDQFRPVFLADPEVRIQQVTINGEPWKQFQPKEQVITLPEGEALRLTITLQ